MELRNKHKKLLEKVLLLVNALLRKSLDGWRFDNFSTMKTSLIKYRKFLKMDESGELEKLPGKEEAAIRRQMSRMNRNFEGILNIEELPAALIVIDVKNEEIAVAEANRLNIPVIGLVDTNSDPTPVQHPIPGNDDAVKSIRIIIETLVDAIDSGRDKRELKKSSKVSKSVTPETTFEQEDDVEVTLPEGYEGEE